MNSPEKIGLALDLFPHLKFEGDLAIMAMVMDQALPSIRAQIPQDPAAVDAMLDQGIEYLQSLKSDVEPDAAAALPEGTPEEVVADGV